MLRYLGRDCDLERPESTDLGDLTDWVSLGISGEVAAMEPALDGGDRKSTGACSLSGDVGDVGGNSTGGSLGGTKVASDLILPDRGRASDRCLLYTSPSPRD